MMPPTKQVYVLVLKTKLVSASQTMAVIAIASSKGGGRTIVATQKKTQRIEDAPRLNLQNCDPMVG